MYLQNCSAVISVDIWNCNTSSFKSSPCLWLKIHGSQWSGKSQWFFFQGRRKVSEFYGKSVKNYICLKVSKKSVNLKLPWYWLPWDSLPRWHYDIECVSQYQILLRIPFKQQNLQIYLPARWDDLKLKLVLFSSMISLRLFFLYFSLISCETSFKIPHFCEKKIPVKIPVILLKCIMTPAVNIMFLCRTTQNLCGPPSVPSGWSAWRPRIFG